jgi:hypothetical protein
MHVHVVLAHDQVSVAHASAHVVTWVFLKPNTTKNDLVQKITKNADIYKLAAGQSYKLLAYGEDFDSVFRYQNIQIVQSDGPDSFDIATVR